MESNKGKMPIKDSDEEAKVEPIQNDGLNQPTNPEKKDKKTSDIDEKQMEFYSDYLDIKEFDANEPLISTQLPLELMEDEFGNKQQLLTKIRNLGKSYQIYRKVRSDGNSFYRSLFFRYLENLVRSQDKDMITKFEKLVRESTAYLLEAGYEDSMIVEFQENILENVEAIKRGLLTDEDILEHFCDKLKSDTLTIFLRVLNSGFLRTNAQTYQKYIQSKNILDYCIDKVEASDIEADETQIRSISDLLDTPIRIYNTISSQKKDDSEEIIYPDEANKDKIFINLLRHPSGYHILYKEV